MYHLQLYYRRKSFNWTVFLQKPTPTDPTKQFVDHEGNILPGYEKWSPYPDFAMLADGFPVLVIEVCSDRINESDRYRMLLYTASILRTSNLKLSPNPPASLIGSKSNI